jgi:hypothetical protein
MARIQAAMKPLLSPKLLRPLPKKPTKNESHTHGDTFFSGFGVQLLLAQLPQISFWWQQQLVKSFFVLVALVYEESSQKVHIPKHQRWFGGRLGEQWSLILKSWIKSAGQDLKGAVRAFV